MLNTFGSIIEKYFKRNQGWARLQGEMAVFYWPKIAGAELARMVEAVRYQAGFLYLQTDSPPLAHQVHLMQTEILQKLSQYLGTTVVKGIKVKVGTLRLKVSPAGPELVTPELNPAELELITQCCQQIIDPFIAGKFADFMQKSLLYAKRQQQNIRG